MSKYIFFRDDDVRGVIEPELFFLFELSFNMNIPVTYAVEPANINHEVAKFLLEKKKERPDLVEIIQHGFDHNKRNLYPYGIEFGGNREFEGQFNDLYKGFELMEEYFSNNWCKIISFPYGSYNDDTLKAVNKIGYKAISTSVSFNFKSRIKDIIGKYLEKQILFSKKISYHTLKRPNLNIYDIGTSVNVIKKYKGYDVAEHFSKDEILKQIYKSAKFTNFVGILLHHRFHKKDTIKILEKVITELISKSFRFTTISNVLYYLSVKNYG